VNTDVATPPAKQRMLIKLKVGGLGSLGSGPKKEST
jgi:hypothetical protein